MPVPVADPRRGVAALRAELDAAFAGVLEGGRYILGPEHDLFETEFASYLGASHCIAVASGTDALEVALRSVERRGRGDWIVAAANAGFYASAAAHLAGMRVRYTDVDPDTLTLSAATVEPELTSEVRAVVVTHLYGVMADVEPIVELCRSQGIPLVEDCAQAHGARRDGRMAGTFGDVAAFSFYPTKNLPALGDAGAIVTNDDGIADRARRLRQYGWESKYRVTTFCGRNSRLDELQAAILRARLPHLDAWNERRRSIAAATRRRSRRRAAGWSSLDGEDYVAHLAVLLAAERDTVRSRLHAAEIGTDVHYPIPDHRQPLWGEKLLAGVRLPVTEHAAEHVLTAPVLPRVDRQRGRSCMRGAS